MRFKKWQCTAEYTLFSKIYCIGHECYAGDSRNINDIINDWYNYDENILHYLSLSFIMLSVKKKKRFSGKSDLTASVGELHAHRLVPAAPM